MPQVAIGGTAVFSTSTLASFSAPDVTAGWKCIYKGSDVECQLVTVDVNTTNAIWWQTRNVNRKSPQGTFKLHYQLPQQVSGTDTAAELAAPGVLLWNLYSHCDPDV